MANYTDEEYEQAILRALSPLHVDNGGYLKTLGAFGGNLSSDLAFEQFVRGFPGVLVLVQSASYEQVNTCYWRQEVVVGVLMGTRSWRSQDEARGEQTGMSRLKRDVRDLLLGKTLGLDIRPIQLLREELLMGDEAHVIWWAEYQIVNDMITGGL